MIIIIFGILGWIVSGLISNLGNIKIDSIEFWIITIPYTVMCALVGLIVKTYREYE